MRPLTRPASEFQVTWSLRLNRFAFDRVDNFFVFDGVDDFAHGTTPEDPTLKISLAVVRRKLSCCGTLERSKRLRPRDRTFQVEGGEITLPR
jgi:hypothetical protein